MNTWCHSISVTFKFWCWVPRESVLRGSSAHKATRTAQNLKVTLIEWLLKLTLLEWHQVFRPIIVQVVFPPIFFLGTSKTFHFNRVYFILRLHLYCVFYNFLKEPRYILCSSLFLSMLCIITRSIFRFLIYIIIAVDLTSILTHAKKKISCNLYVSKFL